MPYYPSYSSYSRTGYDEAEIPPEMQEQFTVMSHILGKYVEDKRVFDLVDSVPSHSMLKAEPEEAPKHKAFEARHFTLHSLKESKRLLLECATALEGFIGRHELRVSAQRSAPTGLLALPEEIMSDIIVLACASPQDNVQVAYANSLRRVCSRFHRLLLKTPRIWSQISSCYTYKQIDNMLKKSKSVPLGVDFTFFGTYDTEKVSCLKDLLMPQIHRWFDFSLTFSTYNYSSESPARPTFEDIMDGDTPTLTLLERLEVEGCMSFGWFLSKCTIPALREFRTVDEELKFVKHVAGPNLITCSITCHSAAQLALWEKDDSNSLYTLLSVLADAPLLETLSLDLYLNAMPEGNLPLSSWSPSARFIYPRIKSLTLKTFRRHAVGRVSDNRHLLMLLVDMPKLEKMSISFDGTIAKDAVDQELFHVGGLVNAEVGCLQSLNMPDAFYPNLREFAIKYEGGHGQGKNTMHEILLKMPYLEDITLQGKSLGPLGKGYRTKDVTLWRTLPPFRKITLIEQAVTIPHIKRLLQLHNNAHGEDQLQALLIKNSTVRLNEQDVIKLSPKVIVKPGWQ